MATLLRPMHTKHISGALSPYIDHNLDWSILIGFFIPALHSNFFAIWNSYGVIYPIVSLETLPQLIQIHFSHILLSFYCRGLYALLIGQHRLKELRQRNPIDEGKAGSNRGIELWVPINARRVCGLVGDARAIDGQPIALIAISPGPI